MPALQQNVSTSIPAGPFVYSTDGFTVNGSITATNLTVNLYKNGAVSTYVPTTDNWSTALARGIFSWTLTTDAVDTIGNWTAYLYTTNCLPVREDYVVRSSNVEDFLTGTSAPATPTGVWAHTSRDLTTYAGLTSAVWTFTSRDLTTYGGPSTFTLATLTTAVWAEAVRSLTSFGHSSAIWSYTSRDLSTYAGLSSAVWQETSRLLTSAAVVTSGIMNYAYDGALTVVQGYRLHTAAMLGNSTGGGTTAGSFQNFGSTVARISYTFTTAGNRAISTYSLT